MTSATPDEPPFPRHDTPGAHAAWLQLCAVGILACSSFAARMLVKPHWNAPGLPSYIGYGKNIEQAAFSLTTLGVMALILCMGRRSPRLAALGFAAAALVLMVTYYSNGMPLLLVLALVAGSMIYALWNDHLRAERTVAGPETFSRRVLGATCVLLPLVAGWLFLAALTPRQKLDIHHDGEVLSSAIDLLEGGIPYRTYFWPHGISDTGTAALIMGLTGNQGLGTIAVLRATTAVVAFLTLFVFALGMLREPIASLLFAMVVSMVALVIGPIFGGTLLTTARGLFAMLAFYLLSRGTNRRSLFWAGTLIGLGYIWRIDTGVYALATAILFLFCERYHRVGSIVGLISNPRAILGMCGDLSFLLLGLACALAVVRLALGFPTREWFTTTLVDMPRYHRDSTGVPLPFLWKGFPLGGNWGRFNKGFVLPATLLLFLALYTSTLHKAVTRRLNLDSARERFFLLFAIYALFGMKTILDRSDPMQILGAAVPLLLIVLIDVLRLGHWQRYRPWVCIGMLLAGLGALAVVGWLDPDRLPLPGPPLSNRLALLQNCLRPTSTAQQMLRPTTDPNAGPILAGVEQVRALLDAHGIGDRELLVYHSASQFYPLLNRHLPTKYYQLGWAADPAMEDELIGELNRNHVRAFLQVKEFAGCMRTYDVPDSYRIPRVDHYIHQIGAGGATFETEIGTLTISEPR